MPSKESWEPVFRTHDQIEAELIRGLLTTNGFPVIVESKGQKAMAVIFGNAATGELILKVPPDLAEQALEFLAADIEEPEEQS